MKFFKKKKDKNLDAAIEFIKQQREINKKNISKVSDLGIDTTDLKEWDKLYSIVIKKLKSMR